MLKLKTETNSKLNTKMCKIFICITYFNNLVSSQYILQNYMKLVWCLFNDNNVKDTMC